MPYARPTPHHRVLLVDDETLICDLIQHMVQVLGSSVIARAHDGQQAIELAAVLRPDVILMDVTMPDCDGIEAARVIQEKSPCPIVMLTAHDDAELVSLASEAGAGAYVIKPASAPEISRAMEIAIARHADMMNLRKLNEELQEALNKVRRLSGLLPICSGCKKIRDDKGYWHEVEIFVTQHSEAKFSHGLCRTCVSKYFPDEEPLGAGPQPTGGG